MQYFETSLETVSGVIRIFIINILQVNLYKLEKGDVWTFAGTQLFYAICAHKKR